MIIDFKKHQSSVYHSQDNRYRAPNTEVRKNESIVEADTAGVPDFKRIKKGNTL